MDIYACDISSDELYHYGIKGMKWGVRRFQDKSGKLTSAGKKRYSDDTSGKSIKKKSSHRVLLENKYREKGMSDAEAVAAADRRIKVEKAIAITAGVTVVAATAYVARNKWVADHCDQVLKSGTTFYNLDNAANPRPGEHLYVNYRQNDTDYFRGKFALGKMKKSATGNAFNHVVVANDDIKIPSLDTRKSTFKQLFENDEQFRSVLNAHSGVDMSNMSSDKAYKKMWQKFGDKNDPEFNVAKRKYFEALRQKGYEAIVDEWDTNPFVYRSDAPLILLNTSSKSLGEMTIKELSAREVLLAQANSKHYEPTRTALTLLGVPHTNRFTESERYLSRYAAKSAKNSQYIDKAIKEISKTGKSFDAREHALKMQGSNVAELGKILSKNKNMTVSEAAKKALKRQERADMVESLAYAGLLSTPFVALSAVQQRAYVETYIREHPNTKLTYNEILKTGYQL